MNSKSFFQNFNQKIIHCDLCPRLSKWRNQISKEKRKAFQNEPYWGKPLTGFGDLNAEIVIVGLAPAAHGANRTGRVFTGDRSGEWLYRALYLEGFSNQLQSLSRKDDLKLKNAYVTMVVRCAPPKNKPTPKERDACLPYLIKEIQMLKKAKILIALGGFSLDGILLTLKNLDYGWKKKPKFGHGVEEKIGPYTILCSYHPSQQNTFTGRLTEEMFLRIFRRVKALV